jgi:glutamate-5-semialdehyde dehydrogenase
MAAPEEYARQLAEQARLAARTLRLVGREPKDRWLDATADLLIAQQNDVLAANAKDLQAAPQYGVSASAIDRLRLDPKRIAGMAEALREVTRLADPVGEVIEGYIRPNGLRVSKVRVPLGVVLFLYESRPNVTLDAAALCVKSGNAVVLRGGKEALHSNLALHRLAQQALASCGLPREAVQLVESTDRKIVGALLKQRGLIDVAIPRGGKSLIERVSAEATMPVVKHFDGICHVYVDRAANIEMALDIVRNSKCQRPGVCNAAECLLVHRDIAAQFLPRMNQHLSEVEVRGDETTRRLIPRANPASDNDYRTEYLDLILSVKVVEDLESALRHIEDYGSHHTETIVTQDFAAAERFLAEVDSAAVLVNASTRFNDGGELGLGAEVGISTDKFHARGPCGLKELTSYKWVVRGDGQIRH